MRWRAFASTTETSRESSYSTMGCKPSTPAEVVFEPRRKPPDSALTASTQKPSEESLAQHPIGSDIIQPPRPQQLPKRKTEKFKVVPGYSSGGSSYEGSDEEEGDLDAFVNDRSGHSDILALSDLRKEMVEEGDIAKTVVRIETPFGKPIEEIYEGVHDGPVLGSGVSGVVRLAIHRATGVKYAVKCLDIGLIDSTEGLRQLRDEIFIMCQLDHPNIVRIEEVYESTNEIYIVQELCVGGDLFDRLDEQPDYHYTEAQCARLVKQMLSSVRYLHSNGIIHRDLKLENFLFSSTKEDSELKMIDFGLSKHYVMGQNLSDQVGTPYTVAPEIIRGQYNEKSDVWALGVITYLLLSGETPFGGLDGENLLLVKENIMRAQVSFEPQDIWEHVSAAAKAFVMRLLIPNAAERPTAREAQLDEWIQVWGKKDAKSGAKLDQRTIGALMNFKEQSDMQKLLSEVLSFTLLPEQIVELRAEFEKIDTGGDGEISLKAMKDILMETAEAGALGGLTEEEIEALFDSIRVRKGEPTIRWHEFLAAGLSNAKVDDRNLRLAFDRLDVERKGYITFADLQDLLGNSTEYDDLEKIWMDSLEECKAHLNRITFNDFKRLMKGQPKEAKAHPAIPVPVPMSPVLVQSSASLLGTDVRLHVVPELEEKAEGDKNAPDLDKYLAGELSEEIENPREVFKKNRSRSYEQHFPGWAEDESKSFSSIARSVSSDGRDASRAFLLSDDDDRVLRESSTKSPLLVNRALYRRHREMRLAVIEASKQFDKKRDERRDDGSAGLIMRRGSRPPVELEDEHNRKMFEAAARRCGRASGRARRTRNKTVSDVTGMLLKAKV